MQARKDIVHDIIAFDTRVLGSQYNEKLINDI